MQMKGWLYQPSRWMPVLLIAGILSALAMPQPCAGEFKGIRSSVFSLDLKDEPLGEAVKKVSAITGYQIMINPEWGDWPISARLQNVTIDLGLRQILSKLNHFIVFSEAEHRISIVIESERGIWLRQSMKARQVPHHHRRCI
jgi:type II secretory pathway component GspD/PulD (secretin)